MSSQTISSLTQPHALVSDAGNVTAIGSLSLGDVALAFDHSGLAGGSPWASPGRRSENPRSAAPTLRGVVPIR